MAGTAVQTVDLAGMLEDLMSSVEDVRVYPFVSDAVRVPAAVVTQPSVDFADVTTGFCSAAWIFPVYLVVARANDRVAQQTLSQLLLDVVSALDTDVPGVISVEPQDARPTSVAVNGQDLPAYLLNIKIRA